MFKALLLLLLVAFVASNPLCPNGRTIGQPCLGNGQEGFCQSDCSWKYPPHSLTGAALDEKFVPKSNCCDLLPSQFRCCLRPPRPVDLPTETKTCESGFAVGVSGDCEPVIEETGSADTCPAGQVSDGAGQCVAEAAVHVPVAKTQATCPNQGRVHQACVGEGYAGTCTPESECVGATRDAIARTGCCDRLAGSIKCCVNKGSGKTDGGETIDEPIDDEDSSGMAGNDETVCPTTNRVVLRSGPCKASAKIDLVNSDEKFTLLSSPAGQQSTCADQYRWIHVRRQSDNKEGYLTTSLTGSECAAKPPPPANTNGCRTVGAFDLPPGRAVGVKSLWATTYRLKEITPTANGVPLRLFPSGKVGARVSLKDWCDAHLQGTTVVKGVGVFTFGRTTSRYSRVRGCSHKRGGSQTVILFTLTKAPYGVGGGAFSSIDGKRQPVWISPYRTLATDRRIIPQGRFVYIPAARGVQFTHLGETRTHDGWYFAGDTGSAIKGSHLDHFSGLTQSTQPMPFVTSRASGKFTAYVHTAATVPREVRDFLLKLHDPRYRCGGAALLTDPDLIGGSDNQFNDDGSLAFEAPTDVTDGESSSATDEAGFPTYAIIVIVLAAIVLVTALAVAIFVLRQSKYSAMETQEAI